MHSHVLHLFKHLSSLGKKKRFYYLTSVIIMYYIMSLAKFGNCCSMVWAHRQGQWKGKNFGIPFSEDDDCNGVKCPYLQRFGKATFCVLWRARRANQPLESNHESSVQSQACSVGIKVHQVLKHYALSWYKLWRQNAHEFYYKPTRDSHECIIQFNEKFITLVIHSFMNSFQSRKTGRGCFDHEVLSHRRTIDLWADS